jgi:hypothetical protein
MNMAGSRPGVVLNAADDFTGWIGNHAPWWRAGGMIAGFPIAGVPKPRRLG